MPPAAPAPAPAPQPATAEMDEQPSWAEGYGDGPTHPPEEKPKPPSRFSTTEIILVSFVALVFGLLATFEITAPVLGFLEALYYRKKGLSSTVWLLSFGIGALLGLVPFLNWFVYLINFWIVVYIDKRHPNLEKVADVAGKVAGKTKGGPGGTTASSPGGPNPGGPISHEVSPTNIQHEVAGPPETSAPNGNDRGVGREDATPKKPLNALEEQERDIANPEAKEEEDLFNTPPADPFAARHQREKEAEEEKERRLAGAERKAAKEKEDEEAERRANTGGAFLKALRKDLNNPLEASQVVGEETPKPEHITNQEGAGEDEEENDEEDQPPQDGRVVNLRNKNRFPRKAV